MGVTLWHRVDQPLPQQVITQLNLGCQLNINCGTISGTTVPYMHHDQPVTMHRHISHRCHLNDSCQVCESGGCLATVVATAPRCGGFLKHTVAWAWACHVCIFCGDHVLSLARASVAFEFFMTRGAPWRLFCLLRGCVALEYGSVSLGLHCFLRSAHALYCRSRRYLASVAFSVLHVVHRGVTGQSAAHETTFPHSLQCPQASTRTGEHQAAL